eukprot:GILK01011582.1.p1 GENE.GILK01011582.1~~GILK01011582.1.p1  ORF type:complete len:1383 (-),score=265.40 GILK01011582.1:214-4362(-)
MSAAMDGLDKLKCSLCGQHVLVHELDTHSRHCDAERSRAQASKPTENWRSWSIREVGSWLCDIGMGAYCDMFCKHAIAGDVLLELTSQDLTEIGVLSVGDRRRILSSIQNLNGSAQAPSPAASSSPDTEDRSCVHLALLFACPLVYRDPLSQSLVCVEELDIEAEQMLLQSALVEANKQVRLRIETATVENLGTLVQQGAEVVHLTGHAHVGGSLLFEDGRGGGQLIDRTSLQDLFAGRQHSVKCLFVSCCYSYEVAEAFVTAGIAHVVAIQREQRVLDAAARKFAHAFYLSLFTGKTILQAFRYGLWITAHSSDVPNGAEEAKKFRLLPEIKTECDSTCEPTVEPSYHDVALFANVLRGRYVAVGNANSFGNGSPDHSKFVQYLPPVPEILIGRQEEVWMCVGHLLTRRTVTIAGAPGTGKSTVAIAVGHFMLTRRMFAHGAIFVRLAGLQTVEGVVFALCSCLGISWEHEKQRTSAATPLDAMLTAIGDRNLLIILDNCEDLVEQSNGGNLRNGFQELLNSFLHRTRGVKLLLTSRRSFALDSNYVTVPATVHITALRSPHSSRLLQRMVPSLEAPTCNTLAQLCGHLPLALRVVGRLLANRPDLGPDTLISRLKDEGRRLQITEYSSCIGPCVGALTPCCRLILTLLSIFPGTFTAEAAHAVTAFQQPDITDSMLGTLLQYRLLEFDVISRRYHMHDLIRIYLRVNYVPSRPSISKPPPLSPTQLKTFQFGQDLFSSDLNQVGTDVIRQRHQRLLEGRRGFLQYYRDLLDEQCGRYRQGGTVAMQALRRFDLDRHNVEEALQIARTRTSRKWLFYLVYTGRDLFRVRFHTDLRVDLNETCLAYLMTLKVVQSIEAFGTDWADIINGDNGLRNGPASSARKIFAVASRRNRELQMEREQHRLEQMKLGLEAKADAEPASPAPVLSFKDRSVLQTHGPSIESQVGGGVPGERRTSAKVFGNELRLDDALLATVLMELATAYRDLGKYGQAAVLCRRALYIRERVLVESHPDVADALNLIATLSYDQGDFVSAEPVFWRSMLILQECSPQHPTFADSLSALAQLNLEFKNNFKQAEKLFLRCLAIRRQALGPLHPSVASTTNSLALLFHRQGRFEDAESMARKALEVRERVLGFEHKDTADSIHNLAGILEDQGRYEEAETLYQRSLDVREKVLSRNHHKTGETLNNLAILYRRQGRLCEAEPLLERSLSLVEETLGPKHLSVSSVLNNLAVLRRETGQLANAQELLSRCLIIKEEVLGPDHPSLATVMTNIASILNLQGQFTEALRWARKAVKIREKSIGLRHCDSAKTLLQCAVALFGHHRNLLDPITVEDRQQMEQQLSDYLRIINEICRNETANNRKSPLSTAETAELTSLMATMFES